MAVRAALRIIAQVRVTLGVHKSIQAQAYQRPYQNSQDNIDYFKSHRPLQIPNSVM